MWHGLTGKCGGLVLRMEASGQVHAVAGPFGRVWRARPHPEPGATTRSYEQQQVLQTDALTCDRCGGVLDPHETGRDFSPAYCIHPCDHCIACGEWTWPERPTRPTRRSVPSSHPAVARARSAPTEGEIA